jgi:hypothetical protein
MTKARPQPGEAGTGTVIAGSGQAGGRTAPVTPARAAAVVHWVVPAHLACRIGAREQAGERNAWPAVVSIALGSFALVFSELTLTLPFAAIPRPLPGRNCYAQRGCDDRIRTA